MTTWNVVETTEQERNKFIVPAGSDFYKVVNETGKADKTTFFTIEQAQKRADALNEDPDDFASFFFDEYTNDDYFGPAAQAEEPLPVQEVEEEPEELLTFEVEGYKSGDILMEGKHAYKVIADSWYRLAQEAEGTDDFVGWHTPARVVKNG